MAKKLIQVSEETWELLQKLRIEKRLRSVGEALDYLLLTGGSHETNPQKE